MAPNLFTFNPFSGVMTGIHIIEDAMGPRGQQLPPHVMVGNTGGFVQLEKSWRHPPLARGGRLMDASLIQIDTHHSSFEVLGPRNPHSSKLICFVDTTPPNGVKLRVDPDRVKAWAQLVATDGVRVVTSDKFVGCYLIEFAESGDEIDLWFQNGHIARLVRQGDGIVSVPLSPEHIVKERVEQLQEQLHNLDLNDEQGMRRCHGILAGAFVFCRCSAIAQHRMSSSTS